MATILHVILSEAGNERRVLNQAHTAVRHGYSVRILGLKTPGVPREETVQGIPVQRIAIKQWQGGMRKFLSFNFRLFLTLLRGEYDVVHAHDLWVLPGVVASRWFHRKPVIFDAHEFYRGLEIFRRKKFSGWVWRMVERLLLPRVDALIAINSHQARLYRELYPHIPEPVVLMNLPSREEITRLSGDVPFARRKREIIFQGILKPGRGLLQAIDALQQIPDGILRIVGDGELREAIQQRINSRRLQERVQLVGQIPSRELIPQSARARAGLVLFEPTNLNYRFASPNKFFEYVMAGTPLIASDIPTFREFLKQHPVGILVNPRQPQEIAAAMRRLLTNRKEWEQYHQACLRARQEWNWENQESRLVELYRRLLTHDGGNQ